MRGPYLRPAFREREPGIRTEDEFTKLEISSNRNESVLESWSGAAFEEDGFFARNYMPASISDPYATNSDRLEKRSIYSGFGSISSGKNREIPTFPNAQFTANSSDSRNLASTPHVDATQSKPSGKQKTENTFTKLFTSFRRSKSQAPISSTREDVKEPVRSKRRTSFRGISIPHSESVAPITARVLLLDGEELSVDLESKTLGQELMFRVCDGQDILEPDYFGLTYTDAKCGTWFWLDLNKKILKQVPVTKNWQFYFQVKFYPPEPSMLQDETTRYQLALQVRQDVFTGKLPCSWVTQALLGSFMVQSELGDFDPIQHMGTAYLKRFEFVRNPTEQLLQKICELHATHKGMKPAQADIKYLETAKRLELYGLDLHPAHDMEDVEIYIGVGVSGVVIYRDRIRIGRFAWPKVLRISYKKNNFYLKIRPDYTEPVETMVGFHLLNPLLAKRLWKAAVEHHAFFRLKEPRPQKRTNVVGSHHQYTGHTFFQYRTMNIVRPLVDSPRHAHNERTASVPSSLHRAGLQYNSIHSLNRTHPRDMTLGKAQSSDYLGPTRNPTAVTRPRKEIHLATNPNSAGRTPVGLPNAVHRSPVSLMQTADPDISLFEGSSRNGGSFLGTHSDDYEEPRLIHERDEISDIGQHRSDLSNGYLDYSYDYSGNSAQLADEAMIDTPSVDYRAQKMQSAYYTPSNESLLSDADTISYVDSDRQSKNPHRAYKNIPESYSRTERLPPRRVPNNKPIYANLDGNRILSRPPANPTKSRNRQMRQVTDDDFL